MADAVAYEEQRRRQIEANKRKLEELQLHRLSAAVREAAAAAKPAKKRKAPVKRDPGAGPPPRRSGRLASIPESEKPVYREVNLNSALFVEVSKANARAPREPERWSGRLANLPEKPKYREDSDEESSFQDSEEETEEEMSYQDSDEERRSHQDSDEERSHQDSDKERSHQDSEKRSDG